jgi:glycosyltransferase involved in cell wall biosynthesis
MNTTSPVSKLNIELKFNAKMEKKVKISVLMATYNTDFFLVKRAIDSVLNQDFQDFELLIIDDGSANDPQNRLLDYVKKHKYKISYLYHANCGQSQSINRAVQMCRGEYVTIIDADDEYKRHHLSACLTALQYLDLMSSTAEIVVDSEEDYYVPKLIRRLSFVATKQKRSTMIG